MNAIKSLSVGSHKSVEEGACVMEFVSLLANEPWSDRPQCADSAITSFCIWINDSGMQKHRDALLLLAPQIVNTRDFKKSAARAKLFSDFAFWNKEKAEGFAKYAKSAESAKYAKYAAESAEYAESAAESAKYAAKSAEYAAESAAESAKYAAKSAESAAESTAFKEELYDKAIEVLKAVIAV